MACQARPKGHLRKPPGNWAGYTKRERHLQGHKLARCHGYDPLEKWGGPAHASVRGMLSVSHIYVALYQGLPYCRSRSCWFSICRSNWMSFGGRSLSWAASGTPGEVPAQRRHEARDLMPREVVDPSRSIPAAARWELPAQLVRPDRIGHRSPDAHREAPARVR